jgi:DNA-binding CsgD family transcriptional regulator
MTGWPFSARDAERAVITEILQTAGPERGVLIAGAAGVGKTRLAAEAAHTVATQGWHVRTVTATAAGRRIPLGAFAPWTPTTGGDPLHLVRTVADRITASPDQQPVLIVVDDAHLLDDISAFTVHRLVVHRGAHVLATVRAGEAEPDLVTGLWKDRHLARLDLAALSRPESDALLATALGAPVHPDTGAQLWARTGGNILYLRGLVVHERQARRLTAADGQWRWRQQGELPPTLRAAVEQQMGALSADLRRVVDVVAVAEPVDLAVLAQLAPAAAIEDAERRALIAVSHDEYPIARMAHPLYGEARQAGLDARRLRRLRGEVAQAMSAAQRPHAPADPVRRAALWLDSDLPPDRDLLAQAAWAALLRLDLTLTERFAAAAVTSGAGLDMVLLRAQMLILLNRGRTAQHLLDSIAADALPESLQGNVLHLRATNLLWALGDLQRSWRLIDDALAAAPDPVRPSLLAVRAVQQATSGHPAAALCTLEQIAHAELPPLPAMIAVWAQTIAAGDRGQTGQALAAATTGKALAAGAPEVAYQTVNLACFEVAALALAGQLHQADAVAAAIMHQQADVPDITRSVAAGIAGMAALYSGDVATATRLLGTAVTDLGAHRSGDGLSYHDTGMSVQFLVLHTHALALSGRAGPAADAAALMRRCANPSWDYLASELLLADAWVAAASDDLAAARSLTEQATRVTQRNGQHGRELQCLQTALQFGRHDPELTARLCALTDLVEGPRAPVVARWAGARDRGDGPQLLQVAAALEDLGDRVGAADAAAHAAAAFADTHRPAQVLIACTQIKRLRNGYPFRTPATATAPVPPSLTGRQREVAALLTGGHTNKQIAQTLTVSVRTVEGHIYRMAHRLGLRDRSELANLLIATRACAPLRTENTATR